MAQTPVQDRTDLNRRYAAPADDRRRRKAPLAWIPIACLLGLLLLGLVMWAASRDSGSSDSGASGTSSSAAAGRLTAGDTNLFGRLDGSLGAYEGRDVTARGVRVVEVVGDEAFWIGNGSERVLVHLARSTESPFRVREGQSVDLRGTLRQADGSTARDFGVTDGEGADLVATQGAYVEATSVDLS
ncbi:MAG TPA: hypothetical protein VNQ77_14295 [Frankiaceae bacterium]|nr:hypothetical protein [Frankiaceae bacterium]